VRQAETREMSARQQKLNLENLNKAKANAQAKAEKEAAKKAERAAREGTGGGSVEFQLPSINIPSPFALSTKVSPGSIYILVVALIGLFLSSVGSFVWFRSHRGVLTSASEPLL